MCVREREGEGGREGGREREGERGRVSEGVKGVHVYLFLAY